MLALFVAKCGVDVAENVWQPLFFLGVCYSLILPATPFHRLYAKLVLLSFCGSGLGILLGVVLDPLNMTITGADTVLDSPPPTLHSWCSTVSREGALRRGGRRVCTQPC